MPTVQPDVEVATVNVTPSELELAVGGTGALGATVRDGNDDVVTGQAVIWTSSDEDVGVVDQDGFVTAMGEGSATIAATSDGKSGTAEVTVVTPSAASEECATPGAGWIWCDDFEVDRLGSYFEYDNGGGSFVRASGIGVDGSYGMRVNFSAGQVSAGGLHLAFGETPDSYFAPVDAGTAKYRDLYFRLYVKHEAAWTGGGGDKLMRVTSFVSPGWNQAMIGHMWSGTGEQASKLVIDPASGTDEAGNVVTTGYNDFAKLRWLGAEFGQTQLFDGNHVGAWYCVEGHVRWNDAGESNGVFEMWIDGQLEAQRTGLNWVGAFEAYGMNAVYFENYWNSGSPQNQTRFFDRIVVSAARIGC